MITCIFLDVSVLNKYDDFNFSYIFLYFSSILFRCMLSSRREHNKLIWRRRISMLNMLAEVQVVVRELCVETLIAHFHATFLNMAK
jgi:hypothetical protein